MKAIRTVLVVLLVAGGLFAAPPAETEYKAAPKFSLRDVKGNTVVLDSLLKKGPVYLECWDLPCVNCIAELDALRPTYDTLAAYGLQIVALSVDKPADEAKVKAFVASKKWPYICLLDQQQKVKAAYGIIIKPTAYLINTDGKIVYTHIGYKKGDEKRIKQEFLKWLPEEPLEPAPPADKGKTGGGE